MIYIYVLYWFIRTSIYNIICINDKLNFITNLAYRSDYLLNVKEINRNNWN